MASNQWPVLTTVIMTLTLHSKRGNLAQLCLTQLPTCPASPCIKMYIWYKVCELMYMHETWGNIYVKNKLFILNRMRLIEASSNFEVHIFFLFSITADIKVIRSLRICFQIIFPSWHFTFYRICVTFQIFLLPKPTKVRSF